MNEVIQWSQWLAKNGTKADRVYLERAIFSLISNDKIGAAWLSGSRAVSLHDEYSDIDLRAFARSWAPCDFAEWVNYTAGETSRPLVRLSQLGPAAFNYECVFGGSIPIDLLVFVGEPPPLARESLIFKAEQPLRRSESLQMVKEAAATPALVRNLMDGFIIDQKKFDKLFARADRLGAQFLLDSQRFAILRLAYIAMHGADCGAKNVHTLASLKQVKAKVLIDAPRVMQDLVALIERESSTEQLAVAMDQMIPSLFALIRERLSGINED